MITVIDYGAGNLASVCKAFVHLGYVTEITSDPDIVARAQRLVLPGVGHFRATAALEARGLRDAVATAAARGVPFLGICVGMQWMFAGSDEAPDTPGLAALPGRCSRFAEGLKSPHVGWNTVRRFGGSPLLQGLADEFFVYYTHSYRANVGSATVAATDYGGPFAAVVERGNLFGVQFHPEKSASAGLRLLANFGGLPC
ncbi:MAG TPA: imidazole glycerol phosphate synthase subunit HisH [Terriglobales bacterium]|nr:imidazole glycerol phosphate synthase subunit HisH [Terriglobales bacterium]